MNIKWRRIFKINKNEITLKITRHYRNVVEFCLTNQKTNLKNNFLHTRDILFDVHCPLTGNLITIVIKSLYKDYDHYHWNEFYLFSRHVQQRPFTNIYIHWTIIEDQAIVRTASSLQLFPAGRFIITVHFFPLLSRTLVTPQFLLSRSRSSRRRSFIIRFVNASERFVLHARQLLRIAFLYRVRAATACTTSCTLAWSTIPTLYPDSPFWALPLI